MGTIKKNKRDLELNTSLLLHFQICSKIAFTHRSTERIEKKKMNIKIMKKYTSPERKRLRRSL